jgi:two-component system cell cycle response regulator DivK
MAKIVFCEDDPVIGRLILASLRSTAHEVCLARDGAQGLALIARERPDVIIADIHMPGVDGLALAAALQNHPELRRIPIVAMTASVQSHEIEALARHGFEAILAKPFTPVQLRETVESALQRTRLALATS